VCWALLLLMSPILYLERCLYSHSHVQSYSRLVLHVSVRLNQALSSHETRVVDP
jgi:hypothetical protein